MKKLSPTVPRRRSLLLGTVRRKTGQEKLQVGLLEEAGDAGFGGEGPAALYT